jgi:tetratricopeptide (TPR) repeat protein
MRPHALRNPLLVLAVYLASSSLFAQQQAPSFRTFIHGTVRDAATYRPLERVIVVVEAETSGYAGQAQTDTSGNFNLQGLGQDIYEVRVRFPGYEEMSQRVDLTVPSSNYLNFELRPKPGTAAPAVAPEGPDARLDARLAAVPDKARKEFAKARELWQQGKDPQETVDHLQKAIKVYPDFADAYVMMATAYIRQNKAADAKSALERAITLDPKLPEARFTLGMLQDSEKDYASAEKSLLEGLKLEENSAQGHYELAKTYWALGRWQDAEPHALKAASLQPTMAQVHVLLGNIDLRKRDAPAALQEFRTYLKLDPKGPMAQGSEAMVKKIQDALNSPQ